MDLICPRCAEPWDFDEFHYRADEIDSTYDKVTAVFRTKGCFALTDKMCERTGGLRAEASSVLMDLMGDDMDGAAAMMEDAEYTGMFDN